MWCFMNRAARAAGLFGILLAAGCAATPPPAAPVTLAAPVTHEPAAIPRGPQADTLRAVTDALNGAGHTCKMSGDTLVCDDKKSGVATIAVVYGSEPALGPYLGLVSSFAWKEANGCATAAQKLVELNAKFDLLRSSCTPQHLIFALTAPIGERGLTGADVRSMVAYFQGVVGNVLASSGLVGALQ
jgi:hypothetical protein